MFGPATLSRIVVLMAIVMMFIIDLTTSTSFAFVIPSIGRSHRLHSVLPSITQRIRSNSVASFFPFRTPPNYWDYKRNVMVMVDGSKYQLSPGSTVIFVVGKKIYTFDLKANESYVRRFDVKVSTNEVLEHVKQMKNHPIVLNINPPIVDHRFEQEYPLLSRILHDDEIRLVDDQKLLLEELRQIIQYF